jgi:hypothetical protein
VYWESYCGIAKKHLLPKIMHIFRDSSLKIKIMLEDHHVVYYGMYSIFMDSSLKIKIMLEDRHVVYYGMYSIFRDSSLKIKIMLEDRHVVYYGMYSMVGGHAVAQLVEATRYKPEDHGFDSRWCHWNFSLT